MAVDLTISGDGHYAGIYTAIETYSSSEDAIPLDPNDTSGGVGQLTFNVMDDASSATGSIMLLDDAATISDGSNGTTTGTITGLSGSDGSVQVTADSRLGQLLATRTAVPIYMTVQNAFTYYLSLANITTGIVFEGTLTDLSGQPMVNSDSYKLSFPGWTGVIWDNVKAWANALGLEVSLVSNNVVLRTIRRRTAVNKRNSSVSWAAQQGDLAQTIEINYYTNQYIEHTPLYPIGGWNPDVEVYQVDVGETLVVNLPVNATVLSVDQPICVDYIGPDVRQGGYCVIGADGLAIKAAQWQDNGGSVTVAIGDDNTSLDVTIVGATTTQGPYRIAAGSGPDDAYSSLRIGGTGVVYNPQTLTMLTGVPADKTATVVGATVDNKFISSIAQAYSLGLRTAAGYSGLNQSISVETVGINRADASGSARFPTINDFNTGAMGATVWTGKTINDFNTAWTGQTFNQFSTYYYSLIQSDFSNQAFGNVAGARVKFRDAYYRINTATITPSSVSYDATQDTTFDDFNANLAPTYMEQRGNTTLPQHPAAYTFDELNAMLAGRTLSEFSVTPLYRKYAGFASLQGRNANNNAI